MNVNSIGNDYLTKQIQSATQSQLSLAGNSLKSAMDTPKQFMELLEQSIAVKNSITVANELGMNLDVSV